MNHQNKVKSFLMSKLPFEEVTLLISRAKVFGYLGKVSEMKKLDDAFEPYRNVTLNRYMVELLIYRALGVKYQRDLNRNPVILSGLTVFCNNFQGIKKLPETRGKRPSMLCKAQK